MDEFPPRATIRTVAAACGVSRATVQRVLSGHPRCAPATRELVLKTAAKLDYRPDPVFASMGTRRRRSSYEGVPVAFVESDDMTKLRVGGNYFEAAQKRAWELGFDLHRFSLSHFAQPAEIWKMLYARGYVGVLLGRVSQRDLPTLLLNTIFPTVCCGRVDDLPFHMVRHSAFGGMERAWAEIMRHGYRRIGAAICRHAVPVEDDLSRHAAVLGLQQTLQKKSEHIPPFLGLHTDEEGFHAWVDKYKPEAVLGFSPLQLYHLQSHKIRVPADIAFATLGLHNIPDEDGIAGLLTETVLLARIAVNLLDQLVRHGECGIPKQPISSIFTPGWVEGRTLPFRKGFQ